MRQLLTHRTLGVHLGTKRSSQRHVCVVEVDDQVRFLVRVTLQAALRANQAREGDDLVRVARPVQDHRGALVLAGVAFHHQVFCDHGISPSLAPLTRGVSNRNNIIVTYITI